MRKLEYTIRQRKKASTLLALASGEIEAAQTLLQASLYRESAVHLYFASFYISQSPLRRTLGARPSHEAVESQLHKVYGRAADFPRRYVELHSRLHKLRTETQYKSARSPEPSVLVKDCAYLAGYFAFARRSFHEISYDDIMRDVIENNPNKVLDFSLEAISKPGVMR